MTQSKSTSKLVLTYRKLLLKGIHYAWILLLMTYLLSSFLVYSSSIVIGTTPADPALLIGLGFGALLMVSGVLFAEWYFFEHLLDGRKIEASSYSTTGIALVGSSIILAIAKSVETLGIVVGLLHCSVELYAIFAIPSVFLMIVFRPSRLFSDRSKPPVGAPRDFRLPTGEVSPFATL